LQVSAFAFSVLLHLFLTSNSAVLMGTQKYFLLPGAEYLSYATVWTNLCLI